MDVDRYLARIGYTAAPALDPASLEGLQRAHLTAVAFENLHVYYRLGVRTDTDWSVAKIVEHGRGGWCFENNGAFSALLEALGFDVVRLGAAVLLGGPNQTIDHLALEVTLDQPYLVDVGFGDNFIRPLRLNTSGPQDGGTGTFELINGAQGVTLTQHNEGVPEPLYRFRRVNHEMSDFDAASDHLQGAPDKKWRQKPFATRLLEGGPDRVTLLSDSLKVTREGQVTETPVSPDDWPDVLQKWFDMAPPEPLRDMP